MFGSTRDPKTSTRREPARPTSNGAYGSFWGPPGANNATPLRHTQQLPQFLDPKKKPVTAQSPSRKAWPNSRDPRGGPGDSVNSLSRTAPHDSRVGTGDGRSRLGSSREQTQLPRSGRGLTQGGTREPFGLAFRSGRVRGLEAQGSSRGSASRGVMPRTPEPPPPSTKGASPAPHRTESRQKSTSGPGIKGSVLRPPPTGASRGRRPGTQQELLVSSARDGKGVLESSKRRKPVLEMCGAKSMPGACPVGLGRIQPKENQDNFFMHDMGGDFYVGVVDGHGMAGKRVSGFVGETLGRKVLAQAKNCTEDMQSGFHQAFKATAEELKRSGIEAQESGTTAVTALRKGNELFVANVGDSRCVLARDNGGRLDAVEMSNDHKPDRADERDRIVRSKGAVEPIRGCNGRFVGPSRVWTQKQVAGGLAVSRAFGDFSMEKAGVVAEPEIKQERLSGKDKFLVLASDGVWEHMSNQQVIDVAKRHRDPKQASDAVVAEARKKWQQNGCGYIDDITAVVMKLDHGE